MQIFTAPVKGMEGLCCGYVTGDGIIYSGGFQCEGGNAVGHMQIMQRAITWISATVYWSGSIVRATKHRAGWVYWSEYESKIFQARSLLPDDDILVGRIDRDGGLYGNGYILPDTAKFLGYASPFHWEMDDDAVLAGAAALLLLNAKR